MDNYLCDPETQHCGTCPGCRRNHRSEASALSNPIIQIKDAPKYEDRERGAYWVKTKDEGWLVAEFNKSWGIYGWWSCAYEQAFYDEEVSHISGPILPPL